MIRRPYNSLGAELSRSRCGFCKRLEASLLIISDRLKTSSFDRGVYHFISGLGNSVRGTQRYERIHWEAISSEVIGNPRSP